MVLIWKIKDLISHFLSKISLHSLLKILGSWAWRILKNTWKILNDKIFKDKIKKQKKFIQSEKLREINWFSLKRQVKKRVCYLRISLLKGKIADPIQIKNKLFKEFKRSCKKIMHWIKIYIFKTACKWEINSKIRV